MLNGFNLPAVVSLGIVLAFAYAARSVFTPLLCAFLAAFMLEPLVSAIERKAGRNPAVALILACMLTLLVLGMIFLIPKAISEALEAAQAVEQNIASFKTTLQSWLAVLPEDIKTQLADALSAYSGKLVAWAAGAIGTGFGFLGGMASAVSKLLLFLIGFVFLMLDFQLLKPGLLDILGRVGLPGPKLKKIEGFLDESGNILRGFFRGQLIYALAIGALSAIGLRVIGLPYGLTIGIAVGFLSLIPYVGVALGLLVALAVSFYSKGTPLHLVLTAGVFGLVQFLDAVYLTPKLLGGSVGLHPLLSVVALLSFSQVFGFFGLMLAIPLAAITLAALRRLLAET